MLEKRRSSEKKKSPSEHILQHYSLWSFGHFYCVLWIELCRVKSIVINSIYSSLTTSPSHESDTGENTGSNCRLLLFKRRQHHTYSTEETQRSTTSSLPVSFDTGGRSRCETRQMFGADNKLVHRIRLFIFASKRQAWNVKASQGRNDVKTSSHQWPLTSESPFRNNKEQEMWSRGGGKPDEKDENVQQSGGASRCRVDKLVVVGGGTPENTVYLYFHVYAFFFSHFSTHVVSLSLALLLSRK